MSEYVHINKINKYMNQFKLLREARKMYPQLPLEVFEKVSNAIFETMAQQMAKSEEIRVTKFGVFSAKIRKGRKGFNPRTGESLIIPDVRTPRLRWSNHIKQRVK